MPVSPYARWMLTQEARALLTRLGRVRPFALQESMLPAANLLPASQTAIETFLKRGRSFLHSRVHKFLAWIQSPESDSSDTEQAQRAFTMLRLRFNSVLAQFDLFDNVITQRSENETGVWLSGLDVVSADALVLKREFYAPPPVICYLDRGIGAAIRRARTRMPGGGSNPVAIIRVPRERMVGSGTASSLIHEVGHQAAALLELVETLRPVLRGLQRGSPSDHPAWQLWERWISEIVADFWSVATLGVGSTLGLMGVVSLPSAFVFRANLDDPHPSPYTRVRLSAAMGNAIYPQPHWKKLVELWESYYPLSQLDEERQRIFRMLDRTMPALVAIVLNHRPRKLRGRTLIEAIDLGSRHPARLRAMLAKWKVAPEGMYRTRPTLVFAAIGQGRMEGTITPEEESTVLAKLLTHWALESTLAASASCSAPPAHQCGCRAAV
jgi:hypothetical protein